MQTPRTLLNRFLMIGAIAGLMAGTSCTSSKLSRTHSTTDSQTTAAMAAPEAQEPTEAQGAQTGADEEVYASAENTLTTGEVISTLDKARQEATAPAVQKSQAVKKLSAPARVALKAAVKKMEKIQAKNDIKGQKQSKMAKAAKALEQWLLIGIIAAALGLLLMLLTYGGAYVLGVLLFLGGATLILLSLLDVI